MTAVDDGRGGVLISWASAAGATGYQVLRGTDGVTFAPLSAATTSLSYLDGGVAPGSTVYYQVSALYPGAAPGTSGTVTYTAPVLAAVAGRKQSSVISNPNAGGGTIVKGAVAPPPPGPAPQNLRVTQRTPVVHGIAWDAVAGAIGYTVARLDGRANGQWSALTPSPMTQLSWTENGYLDPADTHTYRVTAIQASGSVGSSDLVYAPGPMQMPTGFAGRPAGPNAVALTWTPVPGATGYHVFGPGIPTAGVVVSGSSHTVANVPAGPQNFYLSTDYAGVYATAGMAQTTVTVAAASTARRTAFDPVVRGFRFVNDFKNSFIGPPVNMQTSGLCGGMSYAVMDYYLAGRPIPTQNYRPANNTTLQQYFYGREVSSLLDNLDKWAELTLNPFGSRTREFYNWGINERLRELMQLIDRGTPVQLGLKGTGSGMDGHQVLAIGYDLGRYNLDLGNYQGDVKIFILDPNYPNTTVTMVPDPAALEYTYLEHTNKRWRAYFVDTKYRPVTPPTVVDPVYPNDGLVHELRFEVTTGADDMAGNGHQVDATIRLSNNTSLVFPNISQSGIWLPNYTETAVVMLTQPIPVATIQTIEITTNAAGGVTGDNWDLQSLQVYAVVGGAGARALLTQRAGPFRFTGARTPLVVPVR